MNRTMKLAGVLLVAVFLIAMLFPFFWIFITSFKSTGEIYGEGAFRVIPREPTLQNYLTVLFEKGILNAVKNSFIVAGTTTVYIIAVATLCAYAISRFEFRGKNLLLGLILAVSMFPQMIVTGPVYNLFHDLGLTNSYAVVLPYSTITLPTSVWILVTHFNQIPLALEESAKIDGASAFQTLYKIVFPLAAPGVFTTAIIVFIAAWNEFLLTVTLNSDVRYHTVPVAISFLRTQFEILWGQVTAATTIVTIPTLLVVLFFQKQIVSGLISGSVKE
ncbi:MAG: carbohydrate ABC transporter permease [Caldibacillus debilis]|jgi:multiple sugar transport system permease protein|uniref:Carbohydrate ABC transporter membrane protein 2, CUT1 family n=3 Tax=Caldibacillus debilis TaxID=301148 RepID=A0A420VGB1_9BACI|nr:carbohydrate ABC transporter permease [Caldibacillus debilis]MBO2481233.1 carbohydrate ABC transporter permease [Bacillaceae bacterium]MBY6271024.1 carbohydrate ABC transporter permease [Bacillaceae bacterium]OUM89579.1 MAG: sugar ABC transporter permease [Caldibacillus debilis]REJ16758.1 MAG: carbohydrate ABC transporter permease [Caldibacillus debilis]REJ28999.1 MAG: carbohydrate ABC transporter permease [Caldibacillus debilis]